MRKNRKENYWMTRPDTLHLNWIKALDKILGENIEYLHFESCEDVPRLNVITSTEVQVNNIIRILRQQPIEDADYLIRFFKSYLKNEPLSFIEYQAKQNYINLENATYQNFLDFLTHPHILGFKNERDKENRDGMLQPEANWIDGNRETLLSFYERFLSASGNLVKKFSEDNIYNILYFVFLDFEYGIEQLLFDSSLSFDARETVIKSIYTLYEKLFFHKPIEYHCYMLWDGLAYSYTMDSFGRKFDEKEKMPLQQVMFDTLIKILSLDSRECQYAALHGLNHLRHSETEKVINDFIASQPDLTNDDIEFAQACIAGEVM